LIQYVEMPDAARRLEEALELLDAGLIPGQTTHSKDTMDPHKKEESTGSNAN
jgi:hypothetical protein